MKHDLIIMLGGPGAGKGTIAKMLRERHAYNYIETGAMFRNIDKTTPLGARVAAIMDAGDLVTDELTEQLVAEKINNDADILMDGFPRTIPQAEWLLAHVADNFNVRVVYLNCPPETLVARIHKRVGEGGGRADDSDIAVVQKRIQQYFEKTAPLIDFFKADKHAEFLDIDNNPPQDVVFADVVSQLNLK
ncbi:MAG: nucleoside monophosphate kinase [Proteobacteria bacterium]|nr:nucleoside monophosphate kinase [Pseudomonadota bacterium]